MWCIEYIRLYACLRYYITLKWPRYIRGQLDILMTEEYFRVYFICTAKFLEYGRIYIIHQYSTKLIHFENKRKIEGLILLFSYFDQIKGLIWFDRRSYLVRLKVLSMVWFGLIEGLVESLIEVLIWSDRRSYLVWLKVLMKVWFGLIEDLLWTDRRSDLVWSKVLFGLIEGLNEGLIWSDRRSYLVWSKVLFGMIEGLIWSNWRCYRRSDLDLGSDQIRPLIRPIQTFDKTFNQTN